MSDWTTLCNIDDLQPDSGVCALVKGQQIAIFHMLKGNLLYAIHNYDPIGKANVLSRGMIGDIKGEPIVASPLYKQHYSLRTGLCLEDETVSIPVYAVRLSGDRVEIQLTSVENPELEVGV
jgi:nitrite reductase (NADH) small subunit